TPVDRVQAVGVHVVRQPGGAPDARHEHHLLGLDVELGQQELDGGEDAVVTAPRTPADLLVGLEVLPGERDGLLTHHCNSLSSRRMRSSISAAPKGTPETLLN